MKNNCDHSSSHAGPYIAHLEVLVWHYIICTGVASRFWC
jgi:hypothetical protein